MSRASTIATIRYVGAAARVVILAEVRERCGIFVPDTMPGCCAITSFVLQRALRKLGDRAEFCSGYFSHKHKITPHCWLEIDGRVIDPTASQFGIPSLVYVPRTSANYMATRRGTRALSIARANHVRLGLFEEGNRLAERVIAIAIGERPLRVSERTAA